METEESQADGNARENHGKGSPGNVTSENYDNQPLDVITDPFAEPVTEPIAELDVLDNHSVSTPSIDHDSQVRLSTKIGKKFLIFCLVVTFE
jgi:hypothetical protein